MSSSRSGASSVPVLVDAFLSTTASLRRPSAIRALQPLMQIPGMLSLGGGVPNPSTFPLASVSMTLKDGTHIEVSEDEVSRGLQYGPSAGYVPLVAWLRELQRREHAHPAWDVSEDSNSVGSRSLCVTTGSQDALSKTFEMILNPGDTLLVEDPTYSGALAALRPLRCDLVGITTDQYGVLPEALSSVLERWNDARPRPKALYLVPTGSNPSGGSLLNDRREQIYQLARDYNFLILEDDPYYYLDFSSRVQKSQSFLSMDDDGRVLRFDSLSKVLSAGMRIGWITGPSAFVEKIILHQQSSCLHASGLTQVLVHRLLESWGLEGFDAHIEKTRAFYEHKRDVFLAAAERHLVGLAEWSTPTAGMFVWFRLLGVEDSKELIQTRAREKKVLLVPGQEFSPDDAPGPFVRAAYSLLPDEDIDRALERFASLLSEYRSTQ